MRHCCLITSKQLAAEPGRACKRHSGRAAGWKRSQWLFLADESVAGADAWLLAVQLEGPAAAVDWLDPVAEAGALVTLRCAAAPWSRRLPGLHEATVAYNVCPPAVLQRLQRPARPGTAPLLTGNAAAPKPPLHWPHALPAQSRAAAALPGRGMHVERAPALSACAALSRLVSSRIARSGHAGPNSSGAVQHLLHAGRLGGLQLAAPAAGVSRRRAHQSVSSQASADAGQRMRACLARAFARPRRDLRVSCPDAANGLWRAAGDETCSVAASRLPAVPGAAAGAAGGAARAARVPSGMGVGSKAGAKAAALAAWAGRSAELLGRLRERVVRLLD